jgi:hypothetical protein
MATPEGITENDLAVPSLGIFAGDEIASRGGFDPNGREEIRRDFYTDGN